MSTSRAMRIQAGADRYHVQVLDRALAILDALSETSGQFSLAELSNRLPLHKSTLHRLLMVLEHHRFIRKHPLDGRYSLGMRLFELGSRAVARVDVRERAEPFLRRLVVETGETAHIALLSGGEMLSVINVESRKKLRTPTTVGGRTPVHCTAVGKAVLAYLPDHELELLLARLRFERFTRRTITTRRALRAELDRVRALGYAVDNEEIEEGLRCVGAPIRDSAGRVAAAISVAGPVFRMTDERLPELSRSVVEAARDLSADLGYSEERRAVAKTGRGLARKRGELSRASSTV
jgi:DNA-binding IclR family transcriptional regulator